MDYSLNDPTNSLSTSNVLDDDLSSADEDDQDLLYNSSNIMGKKKTEKAKWTHDEVRS